MDDIKKDALEYWQTVRGPADGWGQHCHPRYGASHWMLLTMFRKHGEEEFNRALDETKTIQTLPDFKNRIVDPVNFDPTKSWKDYI
jgi:hypothetical protein